MKDTIPKVMVFTVIHKKHGEVQSDLILFPEGGGVVCASQGTILCDISEILNCRLRRNIPGQDKSNKRESLSNVNVR